MTIHTDLVEVALGKVEGNPFESFCCEFLSAVEGRNFIPLGGCHDGGSDGIQSRGLYETGLQGVFYQFSIEKNHRSKIRRTVRRLKKFGREAKTLYYITSIQIPHIDLEEDTLSDELSINIRIRDKKYITGHINDSSGTVAAYNNRLAHYTNFLSSVGQSRQFDGRHVDDPSVYVFLQQESANRLGNRKLIHSVTDTLILWALRETDPDDQKFRTRDQIYQDISEDFPWANSFLKAHFDYRLKALRSKSVTGRELRWHKKADKYCLPFETREQIKLENSQDAVLRIEFIEELKLMAAIAFSDDGHDYEVVALLVLKVIEGVFQRQGLLLSKFISDDEDTDAPIVIADCINDVLTKENVKLDDKGNYRDAFEKIINSIFYDSSRTQREYLHHLSRTYILLFTLKAEPRIVEYFSSMSSHFRLFVGTDVLVKALSERYLNAGDKVSRNLLKVASDSGMKLMLCNHVLNEVYTHIKNTNYEFMNHLAEIEQYIVRDIARNSEKILIRAYFYAKEKDAVRSWSAYISQFLSYKQIETEKGREELKNYLIVQHGLTFVEDEELEGVVCDGSVSELTETLLENEEKENTTLARNSSLLVHGIYGLREKYHENSSGSPFGFRTWWLTNQTKIQKYTSKLVRKNNAKYIMKPEFILNFLAIAPSCEEVRRTYQNIFPSTLSIQLGHRLKEDVFHSVLKKVKEWQSFEPARIQILIGGLSDQLKSDQFKIYDVTLDAMEKKFDAIEN